MTSITAVIVLGIFLISSCTVDAASRSQAPALPSFITSLSKGPQSQHNSCKAVYYPASTWDFVYSNGQKCWLANPPTNIVQHCTGGCYSVAWNWIPGNVLGSDAFSGNHCQCCKLDHGYVDVYACCWNTLSLSKEQTQTLQKPATSQKCRRIRIKAPTSCSCQKCNN